MFCPPRSDGGALMTGARPAGVCPHGRQLYYCIACGGKGWCREHRRWRATCVQCGPPLATALCALHPAQRRNRCPCRRRQSVPDPLCGALLTPGSYAWTFTAAAGCLVTSAPVAGGATVCESAAAVRGVRGSIRAARVLPRFTQREATHKLPESGKRPCACTEIGEHLQNLTDNTSISERRIMTQTMAHFLLLVVSSYSAGLVRYRRFGHPCHCFDTVLHV